METSLRHKHLKTVFSSATLKCKFKKTIDNHNIVRVNVKDSESFHENWKIVLQISSLDWESQQKINENNKMRDVAINKIGI